MVIVVSIADVKPGIGHYSTYIGALPYNHLRSWSGPSWSFKLIRSNWWCSASGEWTSKAASASCRSSWIHSLIRLWRHCVRRACRSLLRSTNLLRLMRRSTNCPYPPLWTNCQGAVVVQPSLVKNLLSRPVVVKARLCHSTLPCWSWRLTRRNVTTQYTL